jgi:type IV pilus assembly protein PilC
MAVVGVVALRKWIKTDSGRHKWDAFKLKPPIFGELFHKVAIARFSHTLASLTQSGVPIMSSLDIVSGTAGNRIVGDALLAAKAGVREGRSLAEVLREHEDVIPPMVTQMVEVGEQTGALDNMLHKVGEFYDGEVENTVNNLTSLLEPILTVVMGVMVGFMVICMYLPMFDYIKHVPTGGN